MQERLRAEQERDRLFDIAIDLLSVAGFDGQLKTAREALESEVSFRNSIVKGAAEGLTPGPV